MAYGLTVPEFPGWTRQPGHAEQGRAMTLGHGLVIDWAGYTTQEYKPISIGTESQLRRMKFEHI